MRIRLLAAPLAAVLAMAVARAWTADDALITFRVVEQFLAGHGPVFNVGERVQVFTHPLWMLALTAWAALGGSLFPGAMALSLAIFAAGLAALAAGFRDKPAALAVACAMLFFSRTLMDFATSGLETPLSFALFAGATALVRGGRNRAALALLSLLPLNRPDLFPWVLPFAWIAAAPAWRARLLALFAVAVPAALWAMFSTAYYGAALPNTALAKLGGALGGRLDQGLAYFVASFVQDPGAAALAIAAFALGLRRGAPAGIDGRIARAGLASAAIAFAYVLWSGGDFMLGRFLLPVYWAAIAALLAAFPDPPRATKSAAACLALLGSLILLAGQSTTVLRLGIDPSAPLRNAGFAGAVDERRFWLPWFGAWSARTPADLASPREPVTREPIVAQVLGIGGYFAPREQAVVDIYALSDPLLARVAPLEGGRPGHAYRPLPREFWRWREEGHAFGDARLDEMARRLRLAHRSANPWSAQRWRAIAALAVSPAIPQQALAIAHEGEGVRIDVDPAPLYRKAPAPSAYRVWLRLYDREARAADAGISPDVLAYSLALDASCAVSAIAPQANEATAIPVARGAMLSLRCPREVVRDGLLLRVGAAGEGVGPTAYDEVVAVARPPLWWIGQAPRWIVQGWNERPRPAVAAALVLALVAAFLASGDAKSRREGL